MRASLLVSLFVAGALSTPIKRDYVEKDVVVVKTITVTEGAVPASTPPPARLAQTYTYTYGFHRHKHSTSSPKLSPTQSPVPIVKPSPIQSSSQPPKVVIQSPKPSPQTTSTPPPPPSPRTPTPTPSPTTKPAVSSDVNGSNDGSPLSDGVSLLTTINKWRRAYNLSELKWSSKLAANAQKTGDDGQGVNQNHELNPGSYAQVITPGTDHKISGLDYGNDSCFELSYVAWLCESNDPQLKSPVDQCALVANNLHMQYSSTGHHDILTSTSYSQIGCAFAKNPKASSTSPYQGLWVCDLAF